MKQTTMLSFPQPIRACLYAVAVIVAATFGIQKSFAEAPPHSHPKRYGEGWECDRGYRVKDNLCVKIQVPANAYLSAHGRYWTCKRGFLKDGDSCIKISVPKTGFLDDRVYEGWSCKIGYQKEEAECAVVEVPENAHPVYSAFSKGWECNRRYKEEGRECIRVVCLLYTSPSPRDGLLSRMPSSA